MRGEKYTFEKVKNEFEKRGYELLEKEYKNNSTKMKYKCPVHSDKIQEIRFKCLLRGSGCKYCGQENSNEANRKYTFDDAVKKFGDLGYKIISKRSEYRNSNTPLKYICSKHKGKINQTSLSNILAGKRCKWCIWETKRGEGASGWKGGVTDLNDLLREKIAFWRQEVLKKHNYKCDITGINFIDMEIHHIIPFHVIRDKVIKELGLEHKKKLSEFTQEEIEAVVNLFEEKHTKANGVPLNRDLHKLFHQLYGFDTNSQDYDEFKQRYRNGEFKVNSIEEWKSKTEELIRKKKEKPYVVYKGEKISFAKASKITGIRLNTLHERYKRGDRGERLFRPVKGVGLQKLTKNDVIEIKKLLEKGEKQADIAKKYSVSESTITGIKKESTKKYRITNTNHEETV